MLRFLSIRTCSKIFRCSETSLHIEMVRQRRPRGASPLIIRWHQVCRPQSCCSLSVLECPHPLSLIGFLRSTSRPTSCAKHDHVVTVRCRFPQWLRQGVRTDWRQSGAEQIGDSRVQNVRCRRRPRHSSGGHFPGHGTKTAFELPIRRASAKRCGLRLAACDPSGACVG